jgi:hypothetical protein
MNEKIAVVITSISSPNRVLCDIAQSAKERNCQFIVIGDESSPLNFELDGCNFYSLKQQVETGLKFAELCPKRHYARKNIGYLLAIQQKSSRIIELDDDNIPRDDFWPPRKREQYVPTIKNAGWVNVYSYFTETKIWPRGFPLDAVQSQNPLWDSLDISQVDCPIQQGLADENPDVDAIYRLICPLPQNFRKDRRLALKSGTWCPFNSQNTTWWPDAYKLMYLPAYCSFRMTDIWRSFVAQRIAWINGWSILFHEPTVWQERNKHDLMHDFSQEVPGYLYNRSICEALEGLNLLPGIDKLNDNLLFCYEKLVSMSLIKEQELSLLDAWLSDLDKATRA